MRFRSAKNQKHLIESRAAWKNRSRIRSQAKKCCNKNTLLGDHVKKCAVKSLMQRKMIDEKTITLEHQRITKPYLEVQTMAAKKKTAKKAAPKKAAPKKAAKKKKK